MTSSFPAATSATSASLRSSTSRAASAAATWLRAASTSRRSTGCSRASRMRAAGAAASSRYASWWRRRRSRRCSSLTGNRHFADEKRGGADRAAHIGIGAGGGDVEIHAFQVPGDGHLVHGVLDRAMLDPEAARAARIIAGHAVDALPHELGHQQSGIEPGEEGLAAQPAVARRHDQVVNPPGVARGLQSQPPRRVAAEHVAVEHAVADQLAIARRGALLVERAARERLRQMRPLVHLEKGGKYPRAGGVEQERRLAVLAGAADGADEMPDEAARHVGGEGDRRLAGAQAPGAEARERPLAGDAPDPGGVL